MTTEQQTQFFNIEDLNIPKDYAFKCISQANRGDLYLTPDGVMTWMNISNSEAYLVILKPLNPQGEYVPTGEVRRAHFNEYYKSFAGRIELCKRHITNDEYEIYKQK